MLVQPVLYPQRNEVRSPSPCPQKDVTDALDRVVHFARQTRLDARPGDHRADLADSLPDYPGQLRLRVRPGVQEEVAVARGVALRHQSCGEFDLYADPIRDAKPAAGGGGHSDRLGDNHLDRDRCVATLPLGGCRPGAVLYLGVAGDSSAIVDHGDELVKP